MGKRAILRLVCDRCGASAEQGITDLKNPETIVLSGWGNMYVPVKKINDVYHTVKERVFCPACTKEYRDIRRRQEEESRLWFEQCIYTKTETYQH